LKLGKDFEEVEIERYLGHVSIKMATNVLGAVMKRSL
jgi:hypothetical protein